MLSMWIVALLPLALASPVVYDMPVGDDLSKYLSIDLDKFIYCGLSTAPWPAALDDARKTFNKFLGENAVRNQTLAQSLVKEVSQVEIEVASRAKLVAKSLNETAWSQLYHRVELAINYMVCGQLSTMNREMALDAVSYAFNLGPKPTTQWRLDKVVAKSYKDLLTEVASSGLRAQKILRQDHATEAEVREVKQIASKLVAKAHEIVPGAQQVISQHLLDNLTKEPKVGIEDRMLTEFYARVFKWIVPTLDQFHEDVEHKIH